jgi:serine/threonine-protein kinase
MVGDEFSRNFFLQHFSFPSQRINLNIAGVPDVQTARLLLKELRGMRQVIDAQLVAESGKYQVQIAQGNGADIVGAAVFRPLNTKLGQNCIALAGSTTTEVNANFAAVCQQAAVLGKLQSAPPAGLWDAPESRSKPLMHAGVSTMI